MGRGSLLGLGPSCGNGCFRECSLKPSPHFKSRLVGSHLRHSKQEHRPEIRTTTSSCLTKIKQKSPKELVPLPFTPQVTSLGRVYAGLRPRTELCARPRLNGLLGDAWHVCSGNTWESSFCKYDTRAKMPV